MKNIQISFIGGGNMATSLIGGLLADNLPAGQVTVTDPDARCREYLADHFGVHTTDDNAAAIAQADVVVLAVKPQVLQSVAEDLATEVQARQPLVVSVPPAIAVVSFSK